MKITKAKLRNRCKELGVVFQDEGDSINVYVNPGSIFTGWGVHHIGVSLRNCSRPDAYESLFDDLKSGVGPCDIDDCEWCEEFETIE